MSGFLSLSKKDEAFFFKSEADLGRERLNEVDNPEDGDLCNFDIHLLATLCNDPAFLEDFPCSCNSTSRLST